MTTFQSLAHLCTCVQVLQAYRTTPVQTLRPADVVVHQIHAQATSAAVAVEEVVRAAHPTDPAVRAMERTDAHVVVEERTFQAGIQPELGSATHTVVRLGLLQTAHCALDLRHMGRLQLVGLRQILLSVIHVGVVTNVAVEGLVATRSNQLATSAKVLATLMSHSDLGEKFSTRQIHRAIN
eukprot:TRINITY_DN4688_c1_g1_i1.p4 TRINITY_DN4688_c1_g1~~TRINITY_DN4688_c1_g1_i1.p4  ORF type:complete len:181 (+),score=9.51 TRINITY_DN4688_c1_g1_i1:1494-2036(+)